MNEKISFSQKAVYESRRVNSRNQDEGISIVKVSGQSDHWLALCMPDTKEEFSFTTDDFQARVSNELKRLTHSKSSYIELELGSKKLVVPTSLSQSFYEGCRGSTDGYGVKIDPDKPAHAELSFDADKVAALMTMMMSEEGFMSGKITFHTKKSIHEEKATFFDNFEENLQEVIATAEDIERQITESEIEEMMERRGSMFGMSFSR